MEKRNQKMQKLPVEFGNNSKMEVGAETTNQNFSGMQWEGEIIPGGRETKTIEKEKRFPMGEGVLFM